MKISNEQDLLDEHVRMKVIKAIESPENVSRKYRAKMAQDFLTDGIKQYVLDRLEQEMEGHTVDAMKHRAANISIFKKVIDKKSRVYRNGVVRESDDELYNEQVNFLVDYLNMNREMKKVNKYTEAYRNTEVQVIPIEDRKTGLYSYKLQVLPSHFYDVIEDERDPTKPLAYVLSYYRANRSITYTDRFHNITGDAGPGDFRNGDRRNSIIADSPNDVGSDEQKEYIFWTDSYHFTTDARGVLIPELSPEDFLNPIGRLPFVSFAKETDGQFWALGGDDLIEETIGINLLLTDMYFNSKMSAGVLLGYGKGLPSNLKVGPNAALIVEVQEGDPTPSLQFVAPNPDLNAQMKMIEQKVAMLLSTNNLEPNTISGNLTVQNANSGIQEMIQKSEVTSSIEDEQELFRDKEPEVFEVVARWHNYFYEKNLLNQDLRDLGPIDLDAEFSLKFLPAQPYMTEKEKLEILEKRKALGLDSELDMLMRDNPDLLPEEAEAKLAEVKEEKQANAAAFGLAPMEDEKPQDEEDQDGEESNEES